MSTGVDWGKVMKVVMGFVIAVYFVTGLIAGTIGIMKMNEDDNGSARTTANHVEN